MRFLLCWALSLLLIFTPHVIFGWLPGGLQTAFAAEAQTAADKVTLAVLDLKTQGDVSADSARIISDRVRAELFHTGRYRIIERAEMQAILAEQGFQQLQINCEGADCAVELGKILAVRQLVIGSVSRLGDIYTLALRVVDVEKGTILKEGFRDCRCELEEVLTRMSSSLALELANDTSVKVPAGELDPRLVAAMPLPERQAYFDKHSKSPWLAAGLNGFLPLPFGYGYVGDWGMFWTMALVELGVVGSAVAFQVSNPRNPTNNLLFNGGMILYVGLAVFTVVDVWLRADKGNQVLRRDLRLEASQPGIDLASGLNRESALAPSVPLYNFSF